MGYKSLQIEKNAYGNVRLTKMLHAILVLLLFSSMLAKGQQKESEPNLGEDGEEEVEEETATTNSTTTTATTSPSTSMTSGSPTIFTTKMLIFSIILSMKFFQA